MVVFQLNKLTVTRGDTRILKEFSFTVEAGSLCFITGLNGSGKTTLLQALCKMLPYSGSILFYGSEIASWKSSDLAGCLSVIHQLQTQAFSFTVREFVLLGRFHQLGFWGGYGPKDQERVDECAVLVGIDGWLDRRLSELSGGELQKVYLAQALVQDTSVILLDEPCRFLDPLNRKEIYDLLNHLVGTGKTILCVSHDSEIFNYSGARFLGIRGGELIWDACISDRVVLDEMRSKVYGLPF